MRKLFLCVAIAVALVLHNPSVLASTYSIPPEKIDIQKVYLGAATGFEKAAKVDYESVIKATPEYEEVKRKHIEPGTGKYWILLSQASNRAVRAISEVGQHTGYDFMAAQAYLGGLEPGIPSEDITPLVLDRVRDVAKSPKNNDLKDKSKSKDKDESKPGKKKQ
ncbi:MAG: hypothetical protein NTU83_12410 [Candidatus Hydrogenedentes bacterium]|nr:hypothetical protein [Candidatus Hydrogenedentota bacterium]